MGKFAKTLSDYFKLPFEVYYEGPIEVTMYEFKSKFEPKRFKDVHAVRKEQGKAFGVTFACEQNNGPELYCCVTGAHDEVEPEWLSLITEDEIDFNYGQDFAVIVEKQEISFVDDEVDGVDEMDSYCSFTFLKYHLEDIQPDCIILDAKNTRVKINSDGYVIDDNNVVLESQRIFNPDDLDSEEYEDCAGRDLWEAKFDWVQKTLEIDFPEDKNLKLSSATE